MMKTQKYLNKVFWARTFAPNPSALRPKRKQNRFFLFRGQFLPEIKGKNVHHITACMWFIRFTSLHSFTHICG